jgi:hypothetical protein
VELTWARALSWRLSRQLLDPVGTGSVADVVRRLGALPAWPDLTAELGVAARRTGGRDGDARAALVAGDVVKVFAFRGALHLMTPQDAGAYLAVRASNRMWELKSWVDYYDLAPSEWPAFREHVRTALADGPLTRTELLAAFGRSRRYQHLVPLLADGNDTLLKPLSWQGDMGLGAGRDGESTFVGLHQVPGWAGVPDLEEAGPKVVAAYLRAYGPATATRVRTWFKGLGAKPRDVTRWLERLDDVTRTVTIGGTEALVMSDDVAELRHAPISGSLLLLPGRDHWIMAPGTTDEHVVPQRHRQVFSHSSNPVVHRGVAAGTWAVRGERLEVTWFASSGRVPRAAIAEQAAHLSTFLARPLTVSVTSG